MDKLKKCCGCKNEVSISNFYKNKSTLDGHSIYCKSCTKINSKKYFENKKLKHNKIDNDVFMNFIVSKNFNIETNNSENLMKILIIEKMCKSILDEIQGLKRNIIPSEV